MTEINEDAVRAEVRAWLEANWNPDYGLVEWRRKLADSGWGVPHWPSRWCGRDLPVGLVPVVEEEFKRIGAIGVAKVGIRTLAAATLLAHGTDLQKEKERLAGYIPPPPPPPSPPPCSGTFRSWCSGDEGQYGAPAWPMAPWTHPASANTANSAASRLCKSTSFPPRRPIR